MPIAQKPDVLQTLEGQQKMKDFVNNFKSTLEIICQDIEKDLLKNLLDINKHQYTNEDIQRLANKLYMNKKYQVLFYSFPRELLPYVSNDVLRDMYDELDERKKALHKLKKSLDNRDQPVFDILEKLLKKTQ